MKAKIKKALKRLVSGFLLRLYAVLAKDTTDALPAKGNVLVIAPHPDDESLGCGAVLGRLSARGLKVRVVIVTDGAASTPSKVLSPEALAATRRGEAQKALKILGASSESLVFLNYPDGKASDHIGKIAQDLASQIWLASPVLIFSPYIVDGHADHRAVARAVRQIAQEGKINCPVFEYPMWFWPRGALLSLWRSATRASLRKIMTRGYLRQKNEAIRAHRSQFENITGEKSWRTLDPERIPLHLQPHELFFELLKK